MSSSSSDESSNNGEQVDMEALLEEMGEEGDDNGAAVFAEDADSSDSSDDEHNHEMEDGRMRRLLRASSSGTLDCESNSSGSSGDGEEGHELASESSEEETGPEEEEEDDDDDEEEEVNNEGNDEQDEELSLEPAAQEAVRCLTEWKRVVSCNFQSSESLSATFHVRSKFRHSLFDIRNSLQGKELLGPQQDHAPGHEPVHHADENEGAAHVLGVFGLGVAFEGDVVHTGLDAGVDQFEDEDEEAGADEEDLLNRGLPQPEPKGNEDQAEPDLFFERFLAPHGRSEAIHGVTEGV